MVGQWIARPGEIFDSGACDCIEFRADGTYRYRWEGGYDNQCYITHDGNYRIEGDKIYCTNVIENYTSYHSEYRMLRDYTDKAIEDYTLSYYFSSKNPTDQYLEEHNPGTTWLVISLYQAGPSGASFILPDRNFVFAKY